MSETKTTREDPVRLRGVQETQSKGASRSLPDHALAVRPVWTTHISLLLSAMKPIQAVEAA